jgi:aminomethyltransferase
MKDDLKKTLLCEEHEKLGARMVPFAGWYMPVQYRGLMEEHKCVRSNVGLFDVSHMGEIFFRGPKALESLQWLTSNDVSKLLVNEAQYSLLTNFEGGIVDDIIVYCLKPNEEYLVCVNAANIEKDFDWMKKNNKGADIKNESSLWSQIAIQGPTALKLATLIFGNIVNETKSFGFFIAEFKGAACVVAKTGYTGEYGVEVFIKNEGVVDLWQELLKKGEALGVQPIGLGARDTLRTEMKYSLYGHEITDQTSPLEAKLGWAVKMNKADFVGKQAIEQFKAQGLKRDLVGFKLVEKGIPRDHYTLHSAEGRQIGYVTSGTMSPLTGESIGIGYVDRPFGEIGQPIFVDIRGRKTKAVICKTPFVTPGSKQV